MPESPAAVPTYGKSATASAGRNLRSRFRHTATFPAPVLESPAAVPACGKSATAPAGRSLRSRFRRQPYSGHRVGIACGGSNLRQISDRSRRSEPAQQIPTHSGIPGTCVGIACGGSNLRKSATAPIGRNLHSRFRRTGAFPAPASESPAAVPAYDIQRPLPQVGTCTAASRHPCRNRLRRFQPTQISDRSRRPEPAQQIPTHSRIPGTVSESPAAVPTCGKSATASAMPSRWRGPRQRAKPLPGKTAGRSARPDGCDARHQPFRDRRA